MGSRDADGASRRTSAVPPEIAAIEKVELHQHVDGSIPVRTTWRIMKRHGLAPVDSLEAMRKRLVLQPDEEGSLIAYLDKFHYPLWITQFYENIRETARAIVLEAARHNVRVLELRYSPVIHTYGGLTVRQATRAVLSGMNQARKEVDIEAGLVVIAMRQHGPHIAKILARQAIAEAQHLHARCGVVGFDIAGMESGNPPRLFETAFRIARMGGLGLTVHAGEDAGPEYVWEAVDRLGADRIGHGCSAVSDPELMRRLARDRIIVECCPSSNFQTGAVRRGERHPIFAFLEAGVPVSLCCDNTTVSDTDQDREAAALTPDLDAGALADIHRSAREHTFIKPGSRLPEGEAEPAPEVAG